MSRYKAYTTQHNTLDRTIYKVGITFGNQYKVFNLMRQPMLLIQGYTYKDMPARFYPIPNTNLVLDCLSDSTDIDIEIDPWNEYVFTREELDPICN